MSVSYRHREIDRLPEDATSALDGSGLRRPRNVLQRCGGDVLHGPKVVEHEACVNQACAQPPFSLGADAPSWLPQGNDAAGVDASNGAGGCGFASVGVVGSGDAAKGRNQRLTRHFEDRRGDVAGDSVVALEASSPPNHEAGVERLAAGSESLNMNVPDYLQDSDECYFSDRHFHENREKTGIQEVLIETDSRFRGACARVFVDPRSQAEFCA